jgi:hypothetical protein
VDALGLALGKVPALLKGATGPRLSRPCKANFGENLFFYAVG